MKWLLYIGKISGIKFLFTGHFSSSLEEDSAVGEMHPEVQSDKSGSCPKWGMALKKQ